MNPQQKFQTSNITKIPYGCRHTFWILASQCYCSKSKCNSCFHRHQVLSFKIDVRTPIKSVSFVFYSVSSSCLSCSIFCFFLQHIIHSCSNVFYKEILLVLCCRGLLLSCTLTCSLQDFCNNRSQLYKPIKDWVMSSLRPNIHIQILQNDLLTFP